MPSPVPGPATKRSEFSSGRFFIIDWSFTAPPIFFPGSRWLPRFHRIHRKGVCEMSSYIKKKSCDFVVTAENTGKVLALSQRFLPDALYCFTLDGTGSIVDVKVEGCILSEMREMLTAIAPWVREGSYISMFSDDGSCGAGRSTTESARKSRQKSTGHRKLRYLPHPRKGTRSSFS